MADTSIPPTAAGLPLAGLLDRSRSGLVDGAMQVAPAQPRLGEAASVIADLSVDPEAGETAANAGAAVQGGEARAFAHGLDRGARQIAKTIEQFLLRIEHLQDQAERVGQQLFRDLTRDIASGNFDDRTPDRAASRLLSRFEHFGDKIADFGGNLTDKLGRILERDILAGESQQALVAVSVFQSITLSIESLELTLQDGGGTIQVSYRKISLSITTTVGIAIARTTPQVLDLGGNLIDTNAAGNGIFVDAGVPDAQDLLVQLRSEYPGQEQDNADPAPTALNALLLFSQISTSESYSITRILLDVATRAAAPGDDGGPIADDEPPALIDFLV